MKCNDKGILIAKRLDDAELFTKRFGSFAKADYETLLFSIYLDMLEQSARDYDISLELGITESKVRNLRIKAQLLYPKEIKWDEEIERALRKGQYDKERMTITIMIEDPSVQSLIKNIIEKAYGPVYLSLNSKLLTLPIESYIILAMEMEKDKDLALRQLNDIWTKDNTDAEVITREALLKSLWSKAKRVGPLKALIGAAMTVWPQATPLLTIVDSLIEEA